MNDAALLLAWRNDLETRAASRNTAEVKPDEHLTWLNWRLRDQFTKLFIAELDGLPVGTVRVEDESTGQLLSWTVAPDMRGQGIGRAIVSAAFTLTNGAVKAEIRKENIASVKIAEAMNMRLVNEADGFLNYRYEPDGYERDALAVLRHL